MFKIMKFLGRPFALNSILFFLISFLIHFITWNENFIYLFTYKFEKSYIIFNLQTAVFNNMQDVHLLYNRAGERESRGKNNRDTRCWASSQKEEKTINKRWK